MALRPVQIRFDPEIHEFVAGMASRTGVSFAEYVRSAALARAMATFTRAYPEVAHEWDELYAQAHKIVTEYEPDLPDFQG